MKRIRDEWRLWYSLRLSGAALGKYIVTAASLLSLGWAALLFSSAEAQHSTPLNVLCRMFGGRVLTAVVLVGVAVVAQVGMRYRARHPDAFDNGTFLVLLPQQVTLMLSAIASAYAVIAGHYADGTVRPWPFIFGDQLPVVIVALLYLVMLVEIATEKPE